MFTGFGERWPVKRIALNMDQIEQYNPPPNPAKTTDKRYENYVDRYGDESWELDALPAVAPDLMENLIERTVLEHRDDRKWRAAVRLQEKERQRLAEYAGQEAAAEE